MARSGFKSDKIKSGSGQACHEQSPGVSRVGAHVACSVPMYCRWFEGSCRHWQLLNWIYECEFRALPVEPENISLQVNGQLSGLPEDT